MSETLTPEPGAVSAPAVAVAPVPAPAAPTGDFSPPAAGVAQTAPAVAVPSTDPAPAAAPAAPADPPAASEAPKPAEELSLLEAAGEKKPEAAPEPVAPQPAAYEFKLPEGFTAVPEQIAAASELFAKASVPPEIAQALVDQHTAALQKYAAELTDKQWQAFTATKEAWKNEVLSDPELGGAGHQTAMKAIARARDLLVPEGDKDSFNKMLRDTGVGNHPAFLRALHRAARLFDEPSPPPPNIKPAPNNGQAPRRGLRSLYDSKAMQDARG